MTSSSPSSATTELCEEVLTIPSPTMAGVDNDGYEYENTSEFWSLIDEREWYSNLEKYWEQKKPTIEDMLDGMQEKVNKIDIQTSTYILHKLFPKCDQKLRAFDCAAGIGRVTENVLGPMFDTVDILEFNLKFCKTLEKRLKDSKFLGDIYNQSLTEFKPSEGQLNGYDVIWLQFVIEFLTDDHLIEFFKKCKKCLKTNENGNGGYLILKENTSRNHLFCAKSEESSMIRHSSVIIEICKKAGFTIFQCFKQNGFPKNLCPVIFFIVC